MTLRRSELGHAARGAITLQGEAFGTWDPRQHQPTGISVAMPPLFGIMGFRQSSQDTRVNLNLLPQVGNSFSEAAFSKIFLCFSPAEDMHIMVNA